MTTTTLPTPADVHLEPLEVAPDTFVIHHSYRAPDAPVAVHLNAMVIRGEQPVVVDTGPPVNRERYLADLFSIVEPEDVRWVFISHDDIDHHGNLHAVMAACPNAVLVANWFLCERLSADRLDVPPFRWRWVDDGDTLDVGDRTLHAVRPPLYDSPTTRGLFDPRTGVFWGSDCYASPVLRPTAFVDELDPEFWAEGFQMFQAWNSPWVSMLDDERFGESCRRIEDLGIGTIATCHGPTIGASQIDRAFELLRAVPDRETPPQPGQMVLDQIVAAAVAAGAPAT